MGHNGADSNFKAPPASAVSKPRRRRLRWLLLWLPLLFVLATVLQLLKLPDGTVKVLVEGQQRRPAAVHPDDEDCGERIFG